MDFETYHFQKAMGDVYRTAVAMAWGFFTAWYVDGIWNSLAVCVIGSIVITLSLVGLSILLARYRIGKL